MILNEETKTLSLELSDADIINMDDASGDITVKFIDNVSLGDIVEVHFKEDEDNVFHRYKVTFIDSPDAVTSLQWIEMIDKTLNEANPFKAIKDKLTQDPAAKLQQNSEKQDKKDRKTAANLLARDTKEGSHWQYYIQLPDGSYVKKPLALRDIRGLYSSTMNPAITNAIVVTDGGWMVRQGLKDLHKTGTKFSTSLLNVDRSYSKDWSKESTAEFKTFLKDNKGTPAAKIIQDSMPVKEKKPAKDSINNSTTAKQEPVENNQEQPANTATETTPDQLTIQNKGITKPIIDKFRKIAMATGLEVTDAFDKPVDMNSAASVGKISPETLVDYKIKIKGQEYALADWLVHAVKNKVITESCDIDKVISEGLLLESPVIQLDDTDIMNPTNVDFKDLIRKTTEKEAEKAAADARARKQEELKTKYKHVEDQFNQAIKMNHSTLDILEVLFDGLVPSEGAADTVAGEHVRAIMRILFRDHNDGDKFFEGYGIETCGSSAEYLFDNGFAEEIENIIDRAYQLSSDDDAYTAAIENVASKVIGKIKNNPDLMYEFNEIDSRDYSDEYIKENQPTYEFEVYASDDVVTLVEKGILDAWALNEYVERQLEYDSRYSGVEVSRPWSHNSTTVTIENLTKDGYEAIEDTFNRDVEGFWADLTADYSEDLEDDGYDDDYDSEE